MSATLAEGIGVYVELTPHRAGFLGVCPFHEEATPSFVVVQSAWHRFGCGAHGTTLDRVAGNLM